MIWMANDPRGAIEISTASPARTSTSVREPVIIRSPVRSPSSTASNCRAIAYKLSGEVLRRCAQVPEFSVDPAGRHKPRPGCDPSGRAEDERPMVRVVRDDLLEAIHRGIDIDEFERRGETGDRGTDGLRVV